MGLGDYLVGWGELLAVPVLLVLGAGIAVWRYEQYVARHGRPGGASMGDALSGMIDVFDPAQARASRELRDQRNVGPVSKTPERDPDDPIQLTLGPDGKPKSVRVRRGR